MLLPLYKLCLFVYNGSDGCSAARFQYEMYYSTKCQNINYQF